MASRVTWSHWRVRSSPKSMETPTGVTPRVDKTQGERRASQELLLATESVNSQTHSATCKLTLEKTMPMTKNTILTKEWNLLATIFYVTMLFSQVWDVPWRWWKLQWRWYFSFYSCFKQQIQETSPANLGAHSLAQGMSQSLCLANMVRPREVWGHEDHFVCRQICSPQGL